MTEKLLVTGGSGFIGSELVTRARASGLAVRNLDLRPPRIAEHAPLWRPVDIRDRAAIRAAVAEFNPDRMIHLASDIDVSVTELSRFTTTIEGTGNVLAAAAARELKRFIHVSTQFVVRPDVEPRDESHFEPYTVYGEAKAEAEKLVHRAHLPFSWLIVRPVIIWGPHHPSFAREIFRHMRSRRYLHPSSQQPILRAYGYVGNTAEQLLRLALVERPAPQRRVFYLGDELMDYARWADAFALGLTSRPARRIPVSLLRWLGVVGEVAKLAGLRPPIDSGRAFRMTTASRIDLGPTHDLVGLPEIGFETGVIETLRWLASESRGGPQP